MPCNDQSRCTFWPTRRGVFLDQCDLGTGDVEEARPFGSLRLCGQPRCCDSASVPIVLSFGHRSRRKSLSDHGAAMAARSPALLGGVGPSFRRAPGSVRGDPAPDTGFHCGSAVQRNGCRRRDRHGGLLHRPANGPRTSAVHRFGGFVSGVDVALRRLSRQLRALPQRSRRAGYGAAPAAAVCNAARPDGTFLPRRAPARPGVASEARRRRGNGTLLFVDLPQCARSTHASRSCWRSSRRLPCPP